MKLYSGFVLVEQLVQKYYPIFIYENKNLVLQCIL